MVSAHTINLFKLASNNKQLILHKNFNIISIISVIALLKFILNEKQLILHQILVFIVVLINFIHHIQISIILLLLAVEQHNEQPINLDRSLCNMSRNNDIFWIINKHCEF